jgi:ribose-phosphate pyrophosphokinase
MAADAPRVERFPDGELGVAVDEGVRGRDVYIVQSVAPPAVADNLLELLLAIDAAHRTGAARITAVVPYLAYARQDRRVTGLESVASRVLADLFESVCLSRLVAMELHNPAIEGFFSIPVENVSTVSLLVEAVKTAGIDVVVAPDLGAAKLAERYAAVLGLDVAVVHKTRMSGSEVKANAVVGDVRGTTPLLVDDMISTGGTMAAAAEALIHAGCHTPVFAAATHGLLVGPASERLKRLPIGHLWITNSVTAASIAQLPLEAVDVGPLLAEIVRRLHQDEPIADLLVHR